jgi:sugar phosphate isomerase/epimerase
MFLYEYDLESIVDAGERAGYDGIELWVETPDFWIDRRVEKIEPFREKILALHAPVLDLNPVSVNESIRDLTLKETLFSISLAKKLGVEVVTVHAGKRSAVRKPVFADYASLEKYLRISSNYAKIKGLKICLENSEAGVNYLCKKPDELEKFVKKFDLKVAFDINHALKNGFTVAENFLSLVDRIDNVHVSGYNSKGKHISAIGFEDISRILRGLKDLDYDGKVTVELDDLGTGEMSYRGKIGILEGELNYLKSIL